MYRCDARTRGVVCYEVYRAVVCAYRLAFDEDRVPDLTSEESLQDVHSISSLLKMYFRELPNPLLTYQLYDKFAVSMSELLNV